MGTDFADNTPGNHLLGLGNNTVVSVQETECSVHELLLNFTRSMSLIAHLYILLQLSVHTKLANRVTRATDICKMCSYFVGIFGYHFVAFVLYHNVILWHVW